jgi:predicted translin family RNA/ssDNA-binding protein
MIDQTHIYILNNLIETLKKRKKRFEEQMNNSTEIHQEIDYISNMKAKQVLEKVMIELHEAITTMENVAKHTQNFNDLLNNKFK